MFPNHFKIFGILDENLDVAYTFDLVRPDNANDSFPHQHNVEDVNVTAIKVNIADIIPNKIRTG